MDDTSLYKRLKTGDETALESLIERYHRPLFAFLYRLTDDHALADDLAQEVFIRLVKYQGAAPANFRAWIFTVARNLAHDHFRSAHYQHEQPAEFADNDYPTEQDIALSPEHHALYTDGRREIAAALQTLPPDQREVVILRFYHDMSLGEIAGIADAPLGTIKSRLFHALKKLKEPLAQVNNHE